MSLNIGTIPLCTKQNQCQYEQPLVYYLRKCNQQFYSDNIIYCKFCIQANILINNEDVVKLKGVV